jgi:formate--tetrahydrofolate ligase
LGKLNPNAVVIVATIRALKYHGGIKLVDLQNENLTALEKGFENLDKHIENMKHYGFKPVVGINKFSSDTDAEVALLDKHCADQGIVVALNDSWAKGGDGAIELAEKVVAAVSECDDCFSPLYDLESSFEDKINTIATKMYGAENVEYTVAAKNKLKKITELGFGNLAVCIAKTQKSLSDDAHKKGRPTGFTVKIRDVELSSGAGFIVPIAGTIMRMPGLPSKPSAEKIDIDENGNITGLF